ncbi:DUF333 domain-containing protein [Halomonas binhaiensis]|uniref:DUF333 domain-containing protein n=1 Tax=Halomonas binhaiensis TaxID=2562282 RepID=A0A5C1NDA7_9GAMM|nr:DUF333 domain-containing protein [Halomonas binhaiensis]QEM81672.1 DUF333 domain-containing protein [Halomonas binhaiensis]
MKEWIAAMACSLTLAGCAAQNPPQPDNQKSIGMPNPASVHCLEKGGTLERRQTAAGESSDCRLPDGTLVDTWELYRRDTDAQQTSQ